MGGDGPVGPARVPPAGPSAGVVAIVLAAGEGRRLGGPKALLPLPRAAGAAPDGGPVLLDYVLGELLAAGIGQVVVVAGARAAEVLARCQQKGVYGVTNPDWRAGKATSIRTGVVAARKLVGRPAWFFIQGVDQPVGRVALESMLLATQEKDCPVLVPVYQGRRGHPLVVGGVLAEALMTLDEDAGGLRSLRDRHHACPVPVEDPSVLFDLNRPEDLALLATLVP